MEDEYWLDGTLDELNVFLDSPALPDTKRPHATTKRETADGAREDGDEQVEKRKKRNTAEKQRIHRLRLEFEALVDILPNASEKMSRKDIVKTAREEIIRLREATQGNVISDVPLAKPTTKLQLCLYMTYETALRKAQPFCIVVFRKLSQILLVSFRLQIPVFKN